MNKVRFGSLPMKCWAMVLGLLVVTAAYTTLTEAPTIMAAVTTRELPVYNVDTQDKVLAISFDAAWGSANTEGILDILDEYDIKTNFFLVGFWAEKYPELVAELVARGHEVGNHSATHPHMSQLSASQIREELRRCSDLVESITGKPTTLFRPPYGEYNNDVVRVSRASNGTSIRLTGKTLVRMISSGDAPSRFIREILCFSIMIPNISCKLCPVCLNTISSRATR